MARAYLGCSGWNYEHWRDVFYSRGLPASRWLEHYAERFDAVEARRCVSDDCSASTESHRDAVRPAL